MKISLEHTYLHEATVLTNQHFSKEKCLNKMFPDKSNYSILLKQGFRQHFKKNRDETSIITKVFHIAQITRNNYKYHK